jgi:hypothetical protein
LLVGLSLLAAAAGSATTPQPARAALVVVAHGRTLGVQFQQQALMHSEQVLMRSEQALLPPDLTANMTYGGGPVLHTVRPYLVFWDPRGTTPISKSSQLVLERYLSDVASAPGGATVDTPNVTRQYYDTTGYADAGQTFNPTEQAVIDTNTYPTQLDTSSCSNADVSSSHPHCLSDGQIQAELAHLIDTEAMPIGLGPGAPVYVVVTPPDVNVCYQQGDCATTTFCGYHSSFSNGSGDVVYAVVPFLPVSSKPKQCQQDGLTAPQEPNGDVADMVVDDLSHELGETITDPLGDAWSISTPYGTNEIADNCEAAGPLDPLGANSTDPNAYLPTLPGGQPTPAGALSYGTLYDQLIAGDRYYTQTVWSNGDGGCVPATTAASLSATFTVSEPASPRAIEPIVVDSLLRLDPAASSSSAGVSSTTWNLGDGASAFSLGAPTAVTHIYSRPGAYEVLMTLIDKYGNLATAARKLDVYARLIALFRVTRARGGALVLDARGSKDPNAGARITRYRWSFGDGSHASGPKVSHRFAHSGSYRLTLTVADTLGMSATIARKVRAFGGR